MTRNYNDRTCLVCNDLYTPKRTTQKFCGAQCKGRYKYKCQNYQTSNQYNYISGNWLRYLNRLTFKKRREQGLTADVLMELLVKQNYQCALTGKELTCILEVGQKCPTNASIDRIDAGGSYQAHNVQLVCAAVNSFRNKISLPEFIAWCKAVTQHHSQEVHHG